MDVSVGALAAIAVLAVVPFRGSRLAALERRVGVRFAHAAQGCLLAFVVVDLLPEVAAAEGELEDHPLAVAIPEPAWMACLVGMLVLALTERRGAAGDPGTAEEEASAAFVLTLVAHAVANVNAAITLLHHHRSGVAALALVTLLLAVHVGLVEREHRRRHPRLHRRWGRPVLAGAFVVGTVAGVLWQPEGAEIALVRSAFAGLLTLSILQQHAREADVARAPAFAAGALVYAAGLALM